MSDFSRGLRFIRLAASLYVAIAVIYTTHHILSPLRTFARLFMASYDTAVVQVHQDAGVAGKTSQEMIFWPASSSPEHTTSRALMSEDLFLSKAFSQSMHPLKVIPYYYRASRTFEQNDITITTLVTSNRFKVFSELVTHYQGLLRSCNRLCLQSLLNFFSSSKVRFPQPSMSNLVQHAPFWMLCMICIHQRPRCQPTSTYTSFSRPSTAN